MLLGGVPSSLAKLKYMIKTIFFDFDGVLTTDSSGWFTTCKNINTLLPEISFDNIVACYKKHREKLNYGMVDHKDMWQEFCSCLGKELDITVLPEVFIDTPRNEPMFNVATKLGKKYTLGIITDNNRERFRLLEKTMELEELFPIRILSADVGGMKDDRPIFDKALKASGTKAEECVFVDNHEHNLVVPRTMGFHTFCHDQEKNDVSAFTVWLEGIGVTI